MPERHQGLDARRAARRQMGRKRGDQPEERNSTSGTWTEQSIVWTRPPTVLRAGRRKEVLAQIEMMRRYSRPSVIGDALYLASAHRLSLIAAKP